jgi:hypothetical protein
MVSSESFYNLSLLTGLIPIITYLHSENIVRGIALALILQVCIGLVYRYSKNTRDGGKSAFSLTTVMILGTILFGAGASIKYHDPAYLMYALPIGITAGLWPLFTAVIPMTIVDKIVGK